MCAHERSWRVHLCSSVWTCTFTATPRSAYGGSTYAVNIFVTLYQSVRFTTDIAASGSAATYFQACTQIQFVDVTLTGFKLPAVAMTSVSNVIQFTRLSVTNSVTSGFSLVTTALAPSVSFINSTFVGCSSRQSLLSVNNVTTLAISGTSFVNNTAPYIVIPWTVSSFTASQLTVTRSGAVLFYNEWLYSDATTISQGTTVTLSGCVFTGVGAHVSVLYSMYASATHTLTMSQCSFTGSSATSVAVSWFPNPVNKDSVARVSARLQSNVWQSNKVAASITPPNSNVTVDGALVANVSVMPSVQRAGFVTRGRLTMRGGCRRHVAQCGNDRRTRQVPPPTRSASSTAPT